MYLAVVAALFVASTLILPQVKLPQTAEDSVAPVPGATGYQIHGYGIPPVQAGTGVTVGFSGYAPGGVVYSLTPTLGSRSITPLAFGRLLVSNYSFTVTAQDSYPLELAITAYNGSGYTVRYSGVWSPFDFVSVYFIPALFLFVASVAWAYYSGTRIARQLNEEAVERELGETSNGSGS